MAPNRWDITANLLIFNYSSGRHSLLGRQIRQKTTADRLLFLLRHRVGSGGHLLLPAGPPQSGRLEFRLVTGCGSHALYSHEPSGSQQRPLHRPGRDIPDEHKSSRIVRFDFLFRPKRVHSFQIVPTDIEIFGDVRDFLDFRGVLFFGHTFRDFYPARDER